MMKNQRIPHAVFLVVLLMLILSPTFVRAQSEIQSKHTGDGITTEQFDKGNQPDKDNGNGGKDNPSDGKDDKNDDGNTTPIDSTDPTTPTDDTDSTTPVDDGKGKPDGKDKGKDDGKSDGKEYRAYGIIEEMPETDSMTGTWKIGKRMVLVTEETELKGDVFAKGILVNVRFVRAADGTFVATSIEAKYRKVDDKKAHGKSYGFVEEMPSDGAVGTWIISGIPYTVTAKTKLHPKKDSQVTTMDASLSSVVVISDTVGDDDDDTNTDDDGCDSDDDDINTDDDDGDTDDDGCDSDDDDDTNTDDDCNSGDDGATDVISGTDDVSDPDDGCATDDDDDTNTDDDDGDTDDDDTNTDDDDDTNTDDDDTNTDDDDDTNTNDDDDDTNTDDDDGDTDDDDDTNTDDDSDEPVDDTNTITSTFEISNCVMVHYRRSSDGTRIAQKIQEMKADVCEKDGNRDFGLVDKLPRDRKGKWEVDGEVYEVGDETEFDDELTGGIVANLFIKIKYKMQNGVKVVINIKTFLPPGSGDDMTGKFHAGCDVYDSDIFCVGEKRCKMTEATLLEGDLGDISELVDGQDVDINIYQLEDEPTDDTDVYLAQVDSTEPTYIVTQIGTSTTTTDDPTTDDPTTDDPTTDDPTTDDPTTDDGEVNTDYTVYLPLAIR